MSDQKNKPKKEVLYVDYNGISKFMKCTICFEILEEPVVLTCGHGQCFECLKKLFPKMKKIKSVKKKKRGSKTHPTPIIEPQVEGRNQRSLQESVNFSQEGYMERFARQIFQFNPTLFFDSGVNNYVV